MNTFSPFITFIFSLIFVSGLFIAEAQKTVYLSANGKKSFSKKNAIAKFEVHPQNKDTFFVYVSAKNKKKWGKPSHQYSVIKKSENLYHIFSNNSLKGSFRIREVIDKTEIGFIVKEYDEQKNPVFEGEALQVFPILRHGQSTLFDKDGKEMTHISYLMGKQINEQTIFSPADSSHKITRKPEFPGGLNAFQKEIAKNISFPIAAQRNKTSGIVYIKFLIDNDGKMKNISLALSTSERINREGVKVVESIKKKWRPAESNGVKIPVWYYAKVSFFAY